MINEKKCNSVYIYIIFPALYSYFKQSGDGYDKYGKSLVSQSDVIVVGSVIEKDLSKKYRGLTKVKVNLNVERCIKGDIKRPGINIFYYEELEDEPAFEKGERCLVFIYKDKDKEGYRVAGRFQGKFAIRNGMIKNPMSRFKGSDNISLDEAIIQIKAYLK